MKAEIGGGAKPAFVAMLKETVLKATAATQPTPPQTGGTFATPSTGTPLPQTSSPPVNSMVISVKVVTSSIVTACTFTAAATTVFAELLAMAVAERSESERAMLAIQLYRSMSRQVGWALASVGRSLTAEHRMRRARGVQGVTNRHLWARVEPSRGL